MADENKPSGDREAEKAVAEWEAMVNDPNQPKKDEKVDVAAWESMVAGEKGAAGEAPKTLSQSEIDDLLGVAKDDGGADKNRGIRYYIDRSMKSYQRLPMLEVVCDRFARILSTTLRNLTSENVDIDLRGITSLRFGDYINSIAMPALVAIFKVVEWENLGLITPNGQFIYSMVDVLFGGRKQNSPVKFDGRPFTNIELNVFKYICDIILADLGTAFEPLNPSTFVYERVETNPRFASIARPGDPVILIELFVSMEDRNGKIEVMIPYATLEPIRDLLMQVFLGEKFGKDNNWETHLQNETYNAKINVEAVLASKEGNIFDVASLKPGQTIIFDNHPDDEVIITCEKIELLAGKLGSVDEKIAVSVNRAVHKKLIEILG